MALRLCKGKYEIINLNNKSEIEMIIKKYSSILNEQYILLKYNNEFIGYVGKDKTINYTFLTKENCFELGHNLLLETKIEYIPILDENGIIGFIYNDEYLDDVLNKIKDLIAFSNSKVILEHYNNAIIYGYNELAYYLEKLFIKNNIEYEIKDFWFKNNNKITENDKTMKVYVEGNTGNGIQEYAYWKVFHEWLYDSVKPIYDLYSNYSVFEYDDEQLICDYLDKSKPFMMARVGNTELWIVKQYLQKQQKIQSNYSDFWLKYLFETSGFFAKDNNVNDVDKFARKHIEAIKNCDFNLCYGNDELAEGLNMTLKNIQKEKKYNYDWNSLTTPFNNKWFNHLKNKKVLIISPYAKSIEKQLNKLDELYSHEYPHMQIITYQSLETQLNNNLGFTSFFEALEKMKNDIKLIDFDVAFICAGAYGYLLADYIKNLGKSSIELCSYVPNWFGIKIKRYCTYLNVNKYWNENWIFPLEKPTKNAFKIEDSCYWE